MDENETTESGSSAVVSIATSVAKDLAVTVAGTVIGLGLLGAFSTVYTKIQLRKLEKSVVTNDKN